MTVFYKQINNRQLSYFSPLAQELVYQPNKNYLFDLSYLAGIHVIGDRAEEFLQGQLSCDLREVNEKQIRQGALCNVKGRVLALLDVLHWNHHGLYLILPSDLSHETQTSLAKTAMFSRVTLQPSTNHQLFGFYLQDPSDTIPFQAELPLNAHDVMQQDSYCCYHLGNNFYVFLVENNASKALCDQFINTSQWRGSLSWHALQLQQKRIDIYPESRGLFLPHRLDLQLSGYISFNKGCYKGQEIIARTHYRAKLKHKMNVFSVHTAEALHSGQKIMSDNGAVEIGELVDYCPLDNDKYLIAASVLFEHPTKVLFKGHQHNVVLER